MRALVTGGGGFLGSRLVERLEADGQDVFAARRRDYDLTTMDAAARLFADARPELVFHLAAEVGGIGANRSQHRRSNRHVEIVFTVRPVLFSKSGTSTSRSPESCVLVVVDRMTVPDGAWAHAAVDRSSPSRTSTARRPRRPIVLMRAY